jgi:hypothetical protein
MWKSDKEVCGIPDNYTQNHLKGLQKLTDNNKESHSVSFSIASKLRDNDKDLILYSHLADWFDAGSPPVQVWSVVNIGSYTENKWPMDRRGQLRGRGVVWKTLLKRILWK